MKAKFFILTFLLLFSRGCDFYSTSLWFFQPNGFQDETNPLVSILGFGWTGLVAGNSLIVGLIILAFYYYTFKHTATILKTKPSRFTDYVSELYFNEKGRFHYIFYRIPKNKKVLIAHMGYILIRAAIVASFLATIHNLCQFYKVPIYNTYREIVGRPLFVIYGLISLFTFYFSYRILNKEFQFNKRNFGQF